MVRCRIPGGVLTPAQYLACDDLSARYANNTLRVTSRQGFQFHGVVKGGLRALVKEINDALLGTLAACGDNNRNVMAPPTPATNKLGEQVQEHTRQVAAAVLPRTRAYHSIWIEGVPLDLEDPANKDFVDPLYGKTYLPRKFKIAFAIPPLNDIDVFTNCCGFIAIGDGSGKLFGYNLTAGGGHGPQPRQCGDLPAPGGCHRLPAAGEGGGRGQGGGDDPSRFRRPRRPEARAVEIRAGRPGRRSGSAKSWSAGSVSASRNRCRSSSRGKATRLAGTGRRMGACSSACSSRRAASGTGTAGG